LPQLVWATRKGASEALARAKQPALLDLDYPVWQNRLWFQDCEIWRKHYAYTLEQGSQPCHAIVWQRNRNRQLTGWSRFDYTLYSNMRSCAREAALLEDFNTCTQTTMFETDVCIVGGGAAGVTLAAGLIAEGREVLLLESGGIDYEPEIQDQMRGDSVGFPYYPLDDSRLRFFGGTTAIWGGRCAQLNAIDFERRAWVPHSGWPITKADLQPFYAHAQRELDLDETGGEDELWERHGLRRPPWSSEVIGSAFWQFDNAADRFASKNPQQIKESPLARILLHASVTNIKLNAQGTAVEALEFVNTKGGRGIARAQQFVLAAGGIETPRLMLASNGVSHGGVGNRNDLVGRFFMEHPHARGARIDTRHVLRVLTAFPRDYTRNGIRYASLGRPSEALQRREGLLNTSFTIAVRQPPGKTMWATKKLYLTLRHNLDPNKSNRALRHLYQNAMNRVRRHLNAPLASAMVKCNSHGLYTVIRAEQAPNPDSRVALNGERDALGMPRVALDWRFSALDKDTVRGTMQALDTEMRRTGTGTVTPEPWLAEDGPEWQVDPLISNHPTGGFHHMGTTRMAASPRDGVVDADCRVHGVANLYVAGSSVFTTSGWANPTLTIVALALRLAGHLAKRQQRPVPHLRLLPDPVETTQPVAVHARSLRA
jgi:choline dehydrogenase-like flavoprotein